MKDSIKLSSLRILGNHGVTEEERNKRQSFQIDVEVFLDLKKAQHSDKLADTYDYEPLYESIRAIVQDRSYALLERLAGEIISEVFKDARIEEAVVSVAKLEVFSEGIPAITLRRTKEGMQ